MQGPLIQEIEAIVRHGNFDKPVSAQFLSRLAEGHPTRADNPADHFSTYFLPFRQLTQEVLLVEHKKSGLWLAPGGHIEPGETLHQTVNREIQEELGLNTHFTSAPQPFLLSIAEIAPNPIRPCRRHYDIWFLMKTNGDELQTSPEEFHQARWVNRTDALALLTDPSNILAIQTILGLIQ